MKRGIGSQVKSGALWIYSFSILFTAIQFLVGIILARILGPADFGVFIAATAFTTVLSSLVNFGFPQALVHREHVNRKNYNSAYWVMFFIAILCFYTMWQSANWLQQLYQDERFTRLLLIMSLTFFLLPYIAVNRSLLLREMDIKTLNVIRLKTMMFSVPTSISFALLGFGPFSLAAGGIVGLMARTTFFWKRTHWLPQLPVIKHARSMIPYAFKTNLNIVQNVASERIDNMLVGALVGTAALGNYNRAYSLSRLPLEILAENIQPLLFSGLSRIQHNKEHTHMLYHKSLCALSLSVYPFLVLFWLIAADFIRFVYGEAWVLAVEPLQIMCIGSAATLLTLSFRSISAAQGLVGREAWVHLAGLILLVTMIVIFSRWGITGVAIGVIIKELIVVLIFQRVIVKSHLGFGWGSLIRAILPAIIACLISAALINLLYIYFPDTHGLRLVAISVVFLGSYPLIVKLIAYIWDTHQELKSVMGMVNEIFSKIINGHVFKRPV